MPYRSSHRLTRLWRPGVICLAWSLAASAGASDWDAPVIPDRAMEELPTVNEAFPAVDDESFPPLDPLPDSVVRFPATSISFGWLAPGGASGFGTADFDMHYSWPITRSGGPQPILISPGVGMHFWSGPAALDLPARVYDLYLDISWRMIDRERSGLSLGITPGYYGDFVRLDNKAFQFTGWLLGDWTINDRWTLMGGLAYVRQLKSNLLPIGGVVWRPSEDLRVDLVFPRPRVARRLAIGQNHETWGYMSGVFGGGAWAVDAGTSNVLVRYSDLRLCLGVEWLRSNGGATQLELGYVFARNISIDQFSLLNPNSTAMVQLTSNF
jgi:hypothetical protein